MHEFGSEEPSSSSGSNNEEINFGTPEATSPTPEPVNNKDNPSSKMGTNVPARPRVKHLAKRMKFGPRDCLVGMILEAEQMRGRPVIRPFDTEEVWQEFAFSGNEFEANGEEVETPQNKTYAGDMEDEHTPRTPSVEWMATPPPPEADCEIEHETTLRVEAVLKEIPPIAAFKLALKRLRGILWKVKELSGPRLCKMPELKLGTKQVSGLSHLGRDKLNLRQLRTMSPP